MIPNESRNDLFRWAVLKGKGTLRENNTTIDVDTIYGVSIRSLLKESPTCESMRAHWSPRAADPSPTHAQSQEPEDHEDSDQSEDS